MDNNLNHLATLITPITDEYTLTKSHLETEIHGQWVQLFAVENDEYLLGVNNAPITVFDGFAEASAAFVTLVLAIR